MKVSTRISPTLHPDNIKALDGYNELTSPYLQIVVTVFNEAYQSIEAIYVARDRANKNASWTPAQKILQLSELGDKYMNLLSQRFDGVHNNLARTITSIEETLSKRIEQQANTGLNGEIRTFVKSLEHGESAQMMRQAINDGDIKTLSAVLGAPHYLSGLSAIEHEKYLRDYHEAQNPELTSRLNVMSDAKKYIENHSTKVLTEIEKAVGADSAKVKQLRAAKTAAEEAFILRDFSLEC